MTVTRCRLTVRATEETYAKSLKAAIIADPFACRDAALSPRLPSPVEPDPDEPDPSTAAASGTEAAVDVAAPIIAPEPRKPRPPLLYPLVRLLAKYRGWFLPLLFALLVLQPATVVLVGGRDLSSFHSTQYEDFTFSPLATHVGRTMIVATLALALASCVAWFTSSRRGQKARPRSGRGRRRQGRSQSQRARRARHRSEVAVVDGLDALAAEPASPALDNPSPLAGAAAEGGEAGRDVGRDAGREAGAGGGDETLIDPVLVDDEPTLGGEVDGVEPTQAEAGEGAQAEAEAREEAAGEEAALPDVAGADAADLGTAPVQESGKEAAEAAAAAEGKRGQSRRRRRHQGSRRSRSRATSAVLPVHALLVIALAYHGFTVILPQFIGLDPHFQIRSLYPILVVLGLYAARRVPMKPVLEAAQWSIAAMMVAGLLLYPLAPQMTVTDASLEQRLSFVDTRFWGLGSGPNSVAPLATVQLMLQLHLPVRHGIFWRAAWFISALAAVVVILWSQSQTTWAAVLVVLPLLFVRQRLGASISRTSFEAHHVVFGLAIAIGALTYLGFEVIRTGAWSALMDSLPGQRSTIWKEGALDTATAIGDQMMTGRGRIWATAIDVWRDSPWFGFGARAWGSDFRYFYGLQHGLHAHNQWLQVLSVSGSVGFAFLMLYLVAMGWFAWKTSALSRGFTLALFGFVLMRMVTEVPLDMAALQTSDVVIHLLLLYSLFAYGSRSARRQQPARARSSSRRSSRQARATRSQSASQPLTSA